VTPEQQNYEATEVWERLFNEDVERMCDECYAPDCVVSSMADGQTLLGREHLRQAEQAQLAAFPDRRLAITNRIVAGDTVVAEGTWSGTHADQTTGAIAATEPTSMNVCIVLTFRNGLIVSDHTYAPSVRP
jgi:ketosteroid isomerase-like protein